MRTPSQLAEIMASSKLLASSNSRNSDLSWSTSSSSSSSSSSLIKGQFLCNRTKNNVKESNSSMTVDGILRNAYDSNPTESILLDAQITLIDSPNPSSFPMNTTSTNNTNSSAVIDSNYNSSSGAPRTVDDVWREIVSGERKELKEEVADELITLEDFLVKTGAVPVEDVKFPQSERLSGGVFTFDPIPPSPFQALDKVEGSIIGFGNGVGLMGSGGSGGRGKRARAALEPLDKAAEQRQRRMIKNRESAARSRERKQAYQVELESLAVKLEEENERLLREKAERTKERFKQLMEKVIPVEEKRRPPRALRRVHSMEW